MIDFYNETKENEADQTHAMPQVVVDTKQQSPLRKGGPQKLAIQSISAGALFEALKNYEPTKISVENLFQMYKRNPDVSGCIREWAQNIGKGGYEWKVPNDPDATVPSSITQELDDIFNYWESFRAFLARCVRHLGIAGEAYILLNRDAKGAKVLALQTMDPRTVTPVVDMSGFPIYYIQKSSNGVNVQTEKFSALEVVHIKLEEHPDYDNVLGFSPMERCFWDAKTDQQALFSNYYLFENRGEPAAQYILDEAMSDEDQDDAVDSIREQVKGVKNNGKGIALRGVKEVKTLAFNQKDMDYINGRALTTEKVCAAYGVPKFLLGYTDKVNNNNGTELTQNFYNNTIAPIEEIIAETITREILWRIGLEGIVEFKFKQRDLESMSVKFEKGLAAFQAGAMTLRQFKQFVGIEVTEVDEANPMIDAHIVHQGASATLLEDVGVDPQMDPVDPSGAQNQLKHAITSMS